MSADYRHRQRSAARPDSRHSGPVGIPCARRSMRWRASFRMLTFPLCGERGCDRFDRPRAWTRSLRAADHRGARPCRDRAGGHLRHFVRRASGHPLRVAAPGTDVGADSGVGAGHQLAAPAAASLLRAGPVAVWTALPGRIAVPPARRASIGISGRRCAWRFLRWQIGNLARAPLSPTRMAQRAAVIAERRSARRLRPHHRADADCHRRARARSGRHRSTGRANTCS